MAYWLIGTTAYFLCIVASYPIYKKLHRSHWWMYGKHAWLVGDRTATLFWSALCPPLALLIAILLVPLHWHDLTKNKVAKW